MSNPPQTTLGEHLYRCYANLAMAHAAVSDGSAKFSTKRDMIRAKLFADSRIVEPQFAVEAIPAAFPPPADLRLWSHELGT